LHLNIGYQFSDQFRLQVGCTNLMDTEYRSPGIRLADNITNPPSIPQYGRMFQVQLFYQVVK
jgi:outer membrane receptor protein involved in Fe transport